MSNKYTPAKVREYLEAVKQLHDKNLDREENDRLTQAEQALYDEGWRNNENEGELNAIANQSTAN